MQISQEKQGGGIEKKGVHHLPYHGWQGKVFVSSTRTRFRTLLLGMGIGFVIASLFLVLSLKVADPALDYNPYRWMSKPHEWLMLVGLVLETELFLLLAQARPTLNQVLFLFVMAHFVASMLVYGALAVIVREAILRYRRFSAKHQ